MSTQNPKPNKAGKKWTELDHNQLLDLIENDNSIEDIALKLERTVGAIKSHSLKAAYELISQGDWTAEELSTKFNLPVLDISRYQEREDEKKMNPPQKRVTRSNKDEQQDEPINFDYKRSFNSTTKTRSILIPVPKSIKEINTIPQTYNEKTLALLTEIRDSLKIIAANK